MVVGTRLTPWEARVQIWWKARSAESDTVIKEIRAYVGSFVRNSGRQYVLSVVSVKNTTSRQDLYLFR